MTRAGVLLAIAAAVVIGAPAAHAETAYRYWTYWQVSQGAWTFATLGPASSLPEDGAVEGWRFAITTEQADPNDAPRAPATTAFADICGATEPVDGRKRIALVVDFGTSTDAPTGEVPPGQFGRCIVTEPDASGYQVLSAVSEVRTQEGLVCGITGYPGTGCAEVVTAPASETASASASESASDTASATVPTAATTAPALGGGWAALVSALALLGAAIAGVCLWKRRTP